MCVSEVVLYFVRSDVCVCLCDWRQLDGKHLVLRVCQMHTQSALHCRLQLAASSMFAAYKFHSTHCATVLPGLEHRCFYGRIVEKFTVKVFRVVNIRK